MTKHSMDRRVARTRANLHQAAMSLMLKKGYEAVTITDICEAADIGRSTFYTHYTSKEDLHRSGLDHLRRLLVDRQRDALAKRGDVRDRTLAFSLVMFEHARDHIDHYRALIGGRGGAVALGKIRQIVSEMVCDELAAMADQGANMNSTDAIPRDFAVRYVVGAYMAVLTRWLDGGAKLPPQRIDAMFRRLATKGVVP